MNIFNVISIPSYFIPWEKWRQRKIEIRREIADLDGQLSPPPYHLMPFFKEEKAGISEDDYGFRMKWNVYRYRLNEEEFKKREEEIRFWEDEVKIIQNLASWQELKNYILANYSVEAGQDYNIARIDTLISQFLQN
jgi:hypothetical protein